MPSRRTARSYSIAGGLLAALAVAAVVACAQGSPGADDDTTGVDARRVTDARATDARPGDASNPNVDARPVDAGVPVDGGLPGLDAGLPGMCTASNQCAAGECCIMQFMICTDRPNPPFDVVCLP